MKTWLCRNKNTLKGENKFVIKNGRADFIFQTLHEGFLFLITLFCGGTLGIYRTVPVERTGERRELGNGPGVVSDVRKGSQFALHQGAPKWQGEERTQLLDTKHSIKEGRSRQRPVPGSASDTCFSVLNG